MDDNNVLNQLLVNLKNANSLKIEYGITGQRIDNQEIKRIITFSANETIIVDYNLKIASVEIVESDFTGSTTTKENYDNCKITSHKVSNNIDGKIESSSNKEISEDEYNCLFKTGGKLYPIEIDVLIPVGSKMNAEDCQVCRASKEFTDSIPGFLESVYAIYKKSEKLYDITRVMKQKDVDTSMPLIQYCNTKIEILS